MVHNRRLLMEKTEYQLVKIDKDSYKIKILGCSTIKDLPCEFTQKEV